MLFDARQRRWVLWALGADRSRGAHHRAVLAVVARAHLEDLALAGQVSGTRGIVDLSSSFLRHLRRLCASRHLRDHGALANPQPSSIFYSSAICAFPGLLIQSQNSQSWGIITLFAGAAVATEILLRSGMPAGREGNRTLSIGAPLLLLAFLLPTSLYCFMALGLHTIAAMTRMGEPFGLPRFNELRLTTLWVPGDRTFMTDYLISIREGARS